MKLTRRGVVAAGAAVTTLGMPALSQGTYPNRPIRMLVPYAAGGGQDITARTLAEPMRERLGQPVIVENRTGASGMIAAQALARAEPDGYTLMLGGAGETALNHHLFKERMAYDPIRDITPVMVVVKVPIVVMSYPGAPFRTTEELIAYAKANPERLSYSSSGIGNPQHLAGELLNSMAGIKTVHVPYRGAAPAVTAIAAGEVQFGYNGLAAGLPLIQDGRIRAIAVTTREKLPQLPDAPPLSAYAPLGNYELVNFFGVFAPAATPDPIVERIHGALADALRVPALRTTFENRGLLVEAMSPGDSRTFVVGAAETFGRVVKQANITMEG